jgi:hypothetical protein
MIIRRTGKTRTAARILWRLRRLDAADADVQAVYVCVRIDRAGGSAIGGAPATVAAAR